MCKKWVNLVRNDKNNVDVILALVGNKIYKENQRQVDKNDAIKYAIDNNLYFIETSAKNNQNIDKLFRILALKQYYRMPNHKWMIHRLIWIMFYKGCNDNNNDKKDEQFDIFHQLPKDIVCNIISLLDVPNYYFNDYAYYV